MIEKSLTFSSMYESRSYSDVVVKCRDRRWRLHKNVLAVRSTWFDLQIERDTEEEIKAIDVGDYNPDAVEVWLQHIYMATLPDDDETYKLDQLVQIAEIASDFDQPDLLDDVQRMLERKHLYWNTARATADRAAFRDYIEEVLRLHQEKATDARFELYQNMTTVVAANAYTLAMNHENVRLLKANPDLVLRVLATLALNWNWDILHRDPARRLRTFEDPFKAFAAAAPPGAANVLEEDA